ncbi:MAG: polysaccharide biosynthesis tyrosine autokinase [Verrucomicrobiales bacterium]
MTPAVNVDPEIEGEELSGTRPAAGSKMRRLLLLILGRWYWIVLGVVLGLLFGAYVVSKTPNRYKATTTLLLKTQTTSVMRQDQVADVDPRSAEAVNTALAQMTSFEMLRNVASRQDVRSLPGLIPAEIDWRPDFLKGDENLSTEEIEVPAPEALAGRFADWLSVSVRPRTRLVDITITHEVPEVCKALADAIAREYLATIRSDVAEGRSGTIDLLTQEAEEVRERLQEATRSLATYAKALKSEELLRAQEVRVAELSQRYLPAHPAMISANGALERLQKTFIEDFQVARQAEAERGYWDQPANQLPDPAENREEYLRRGRNYLLARADILENEKESQASIFNSMLTRIEEASVNQEADDSSAKVHSLARVPGWPSEPNPDRIYAKNGMAGFAAGLAVAFLLARMSNKYKTVSELEEDSGLPTLAAISHLDAAHLTKVEKQYYKKNPDATPEPYLDWDDLLVFRPGVSATVYAEMYRVLRASISLLGDETKRKVTAFCSALPGEGKTATSVNFALASSGQGTKTLLIDLDLRKPSLHRAFGIPRESDRGGITEWLSGSKPIQEVIVPATGAPNLDLIVGGATAPNPGELLLENRLRDLFDWARQHYDAIVLDSAPLLAVPDSRILAGVVDNFCLVVRADYTPKGAVLRTLEVIAEDGHTVHGLVFNDFSEKRRLVGENYSYGYYRTSRYGPRYQYGYGRPGSHGAYGSDDGDAEKRANRQRQKRRKKLSP